jgi:cytochrome P450
LEKLRNDIRVEVSKQIDDMLTSHPDGVIEVVQSLAVKVPETILSLQLGLRADDRDQVMGDTFALMQTNFNDVTVAKRRAAREAKVRLTEFLESVSRDERVANDSVLASIARVEGMSADDGAENSPPSTEELLALVVDLAQAGSATTAEAIANGILAFATSDTAQSTLRKNSELLDSAVDEILRFDPPQQVLVRWVTSDLLFSGVQMEENDAVMVLVGGTNRDPDVFENPDIFDVERYQSNSPSGAPPSLAFGRGSHYCVGAPLARIALQEVFRSLLEKTSSFRLSDKMKAGNLSRTDDWFARGPTALEIAVTV